MKTGPQGPVQVSNYPAILLDLGFTEFDVLARDRIVFLLDQLVAGGGIIQVAFALIRPSQPPPVLRTA